MNFGARRLFPLVKADSTLVGYYIDAAGHVFSGKASGGDVSLMQGTGAGPVGTRRYTLNKRTHLGGDLLRKARVHKDWATETNTAGGGATIAPENLPGRTKSALDAIADKGFLLATLSNDRLVFGQEPVFHVSVDTARSEAERIAGQTPGTKVVMLQIVGSVQILGAKWD